LHETLVEIRTLLSRISQTSKEQSPSGWEVGAVVQDQLAEIFRGHLRVQQQVHHSALVLVEAGNFQLF
jgi:hypothetical protein